ncbi:MAG: hypothetical protein RSC25_06575, partial [Christensenella sp.]
KIHKKIFFVSFVFGDVLVCEASVPPLSVLPPVSFLPSAHCFYCVLWYKKAITQWITAFMS